MGFGLGVEGGFERGPASVEFGGEDFLLGGSGEVEFADADAVLRPDGRAEDAAGDRAGGVEVAGSGGGVERGAGLVIGEVLVARVGFVEPAGGGVTGEVGGEALDGVGGSAADGGGAGRIFGFERGESGTEALGVELGDGEDSDAALGAAEAALEPGAGAVGGVGGGGVDDLDELAVLGFEGAHGAVRRGYRECEEGEKRAGLGAASLRLILPQHVKTKRAGSPGSASRVRNG